MNDSRAKIMVLGEDVAALRDVARAASPYFEVMLQRNPHAAVEQMSRDSTISRLICDLSVAGTTGVKVLEEARRVRNDIQRVLLAPAESIAGIIGAIHSGVVQKILYKPFTAQELTQLFAPQLKKQTA